MNPQIGAHEPEPGFRAHLEWQIESAVRRQTRFAAPVGTIMPRLRAAFTIVVALAVGGIAVIASEQVRDGRQRDALVETVRAEEALVKVRLDLARADYEDARRRFEVGTADRETLLAAQRQVRAMETELKRIQLDIEEIQATSQAPRNELHAPIVGQRDFVRDRLQLELESAQHAMVAAEKALLQAKERISIGMAPKAAQLQAEAELAQARARLQLLRATLDLRQRSLKGEIAADDLAPALRRMEVTLQLERAQREREIARGRIEEARRLVETGLATQLELKRAEVDLLERDIEIQRLRRELETLPVVRR